METEQLTNTATSETQSTEPVVEEKSAVDQEPQDAPQEIVTEEAPVENSSNEQNVEGKEQVEDKPSYEDLQSKLRQYEVKEEEDRMIREQLGISDVDSRTFGYMNIDQQIVNEGKQVYLQLCNEFGIDANPDKIDASVEALKQSDPAKAYEFQRRFEQLGSEVEYKRGAVRQQNAMYEVGKFSNDYKDLLNASPAVSNVVREYIDAYGLQSGDIYNQLKSVVDVIMPVFQEAFNAGKQYALQDKAKKDTSPVSGGVATQTSPTYSSSHIFTRDEIGRMSTDEFAKYEKQIAQQMREGKI